jgi:hypothetical protein
MGLLRLIFGFVGISGTLPILAIVATLATTAAGAGFWYVSSLWDDYKTALRNEGTRACVATVNDAKSKQLQTDMADMKRELEAERARTAERERQDKETKEASRTQHQEIGAAMSGVAATLPDRAIDAVNAPLTQTKQASAKPITATVGKNGMK